MIWIPVAFCLAAVVASTAFAAARGVRLWRTVRGTAGRTADALARVTASAEAAEEHAVRLSAGSERLAAATARLQEALAELSVVRSAAAEPRAVLASIRAVVPRK